MESMNFNISQDLQGTRIDKALQILLNESRAYVQQLIESNNVLINGKNIKKSYVLAIDDVITVTLPEPEISDIVPENIPLDVRYEDDDLLVVCKPKGMVVHPAPGNYSGTLVNALMYHCKEHLSTINGEIRPGILHRIDKDTSGLLLVAKNNHAHNFLAEQIREHSLDRCYRAIVLGRFKEPEGTVNAPIGRNPHDRKKMAINYQNGKDAVTHYRVLQEFNGYSYIECRLETGRTHQIRVHMASIGHPVLNDPAYFVGNCKLNFDFEGQCLHAQKLGFIHPVTHKHMVFESELPKYFENLLTKISSM